MKKIEGGKYFTRKKVHGGEKGRKQCSTLGNSGVGRRSREEDWKNPKAKGANKTRGGETKASLL